MGDRRFAPPAWTKVLPALGLALLWLLYVYYARAAEGVYNDDDLGHYFIARDALGDPRLFLHVWGRPLFTLTYALPARLGFEAVQLTTTLISALTVLVVGRVGQRAFGAGVLAGGLQGTMPFVLLLASSSLTEPLCGLVVALAIDAWQRGRKRQFAMIAGLIPLARLELSILVGFWALLLIVRGHWRAALWSAFGAIAWAAIAGVVHADPLWLWHQVVTGGENLYGQTDFWHYPRGLIFVIGPVAFLFLLVDWVDCWRRRRLDPLAASAVLALLIYLVFSWKLSIGHAAGFLRHLVAVAPLYALSAGRGAMGAWHRADRRWVAATLGFGLLLIAVFLSRALVLHHRPVGPFEWSRIAVGALVVLISLAPVARSRRWVAIGIQVRGWVVVALALGYAIGAEPPIPMSREQRAVRDCYTWYRSSAYRQAPVVVTHPWFEFYLDADGRRAAGGPPRVERGVVDGAATGTVIMWDSHYSLRGAEAVELRDLKSDPRFERVHQSIAADSSFVIYGIVKR